ncbi:3-deoxy-D-manno-octulosonic acid transferase [Desulfobacterota bacterium M19]
MRFFILLYNIITTLLLIPLSPVLLAWTLTPKYRGRIRQRLGYTLPRLNKKREPHIWVHALSVGEAASSLPLLMAVRGQMPNARLIFSTTTKSGASYAAARIAPIVDHLIVFPFDLLWPVKKYINRLAPDIFILIETDFWPNFIWQLKSRGIPLILANGRLTAHSLQGYKRAAFFFRPLFNSFTALGVQMASDAANMRRLGVESKKIITAGNLKYDLPPPQNARARHQPVFNRPAAGGPLLVAGSTHEGEEEIILTAYNKLRQDFPDLELIIAPRDIERREAVERLIQNMNLTSSRRSKGGGTDLMILDTLGELSTVYALADIALVGGSLVARGGHNPLEPALHGTPILFGPHMEDFAEISRNLLDCGGARQVNAVELFSVLRDLLNNPEAKRKMGERAAGLIRRNQGAAHRYIKIIKDSLQALHDQ